MSAATVTAIAAVAAVLISAWNTFRIRKVHLLVNNQLDEVMTKLETRTGERDALQKEKDDRNQ